MNLAEYAAMQNSFIFVAGAKIFFRAGAVGVPVGCRPVTIIDGVQHRALTAAQLQARIDWHQIRHEEPILEEVPAPTEPPAEVPAPLVPARSTFNPFEDPEPSDVMLEADGGWEIVGEGRPVEPVFVGSGPLPPKRRYRPCPPDLFD